MKFKNNYANLTGWFLENPKRTGYLVFLCLFLVCLFIFNLNYRINKEEQKREMVSTLSNVRKNIEQTLKNSHTTALTLALTINDNGIPENFDSIANQLIRNNQDIDVVQLVPDGIIKYVYPLEGNEAIIGYDVLNNNQLHQETQRAVVLNTMYFAGPINLKQGGVGIVGRYPVYQKNKFWGFSAVVLKMKTFLEASGINAADNPLYYFQFSKINPDTHKEDFFLSGNKEFADKEFEEASFPEGNWKLYLIEKDNYHVLKGLIPYSLLSFSSCILISLLITIILKRPSELESLTKRQAHNLVRSEVKYKTIFNQAAVGIAKINFHTNEYVEVNDQYCKLLGYTYEELSGINFKIITHPDDLQETVEGLKKVISGEVKKIVLEKRYIHKNGETVWARVTVSPLWIAGEKPRTVISVVEDITEKKKAEETIKKSEQQYKTLFNDSPIALWEEDLSAVKDYLSELGLFNKEKSYVINYLMGKPEVIDKCIELIKIINVNKECLILHNAKSKEELIANFPDIIRYGSFDAIVDIIIGVTQQKKKGKIESRIIFPNGKSKNISLTWNIIKEFENTLERVIVSTEDITQRKEAQRKIIDSQTRIESLINTIDGIVWECDARTFVFSFVSKKVEDILGYTPEEWIASNTFWADHIHPDDREFAIEHCAAQSLDKKQHDFEYRMIAKDGRTVWLRDIVNLITQADGSASLRGIMIDITEMKDTEIALNNSFSLVTEQNKRLLNFSYIISHNLRSHTSNLQSLSTLIQNAESNKEREELLPLLGSVSNALNETMHNLNEVVNIQSNINLNVQPLNLRKYIEKTLSDLHNEIRQRNITINCHVKKDTTVIYNPAYLENILINCISNGIRYSDPEKDSYINIDSYVENSKTVLEISDNGIGIDMQKNKDKIFGMYKTFHDNPDAKGVGLFITKNQIDAMGGQITVDSELNEGSTFKIYFK
ncbi:PAS domain S-box protein [Flavobacterium sp. PLA-1-15]|uniref:PAS domain S-box protein n=1 Tax=Flavobacterium sp. PLA-1-15 TaxID=3380533 RepID=UPI003B7EC340